MLRLNKLTLTGFKTQTRQASVEFSSEKISVIYGDNGSGKTSFLKILHGIFSQDENILIKEKVQKVEIDFTYEENNNGTIENDLVIIKLNSNNSESDKDSNNHYDWNELENSKLFNSKSISLDVQRGINNQHIDIAPRDIYHFFMTRSKYRLIRERLPVKDLCEDLSEFIDQRFDINAERSEIFGSENYNYFDTNNIFLENINISKIEKILINRYEQAIQKTTKRILSAFFDTLALFIDNDGNDYDSRNIPNVDSNFKESLSINRERIIEALESLEENTVKNKIIQKLNEGLDNISEQHGFLIKLLFNMIEELKTEQKLLSSINLLRDTFNHKFLLKGKELIIDQKKAYIKFQNSGNEHSLNELSSGERHLLTFLTIVLVEGEKRDFLIIDEPEISLNTKWQKNLLPLLTELIPNTQIIVASHSPAIAYKKPNYLVELEVKENLDVI